MSGHVAGLLFVLSFSINPIAAIFFPDAKDVTLAFLEFIPQLIILFFLARKIYSEKKSPDFFKTQSTNLLIFLAVFFVFFADFFYNARTIGITSPARFSGYDIISQLSYSCFVSSLCFAIFLSLSLHRRRWQEWVPASLPVFLILSWCSFEFLLFPWYERDPILILAINSTVYALISCFLAAMVLPFAIRTVKRKNYLFFQVILLFLIADFGIRHQSISDNAETFSWAEFGWSSTFIGLLWHLYFYRNAMQILDLDQELAPIISVRSLMTLAVGGANLLMLIGIIFFGKIVVDNGSDISIILFLLFLFWCISNEISLWLSEDLTAILKKMFQSGELLTSLESLGYQMEKVHSKNSIFEIKKILESYNELVDQANIMIRMSIEHSKNRALVEMAAQVAHDIRSPLAALNMMTTSLTTLTEERRHIIRNASNRINDIANTLLLQDKASRYKGAEVHPTSDDSVAIESNMIVALVDTIVSEKRVQFHEKLEILIQAELSQGYGLFTPMNAADLGRILSNLINNAVESCSFEGKVLVMVTSEGNYTAISIQDNGKGITQEVLKDLGLRGMSHGKGEGGFGLGLYHAKETLEAGGGFLTIESELGVGTKVILRVPHAKPPQWFVNQVTLSAPSLFVSVDDDPTIHQIWAERLNAAMNSPNQIEHLKFSSPRQLEKWLKEVKSADIKFFVDYEFIGQDENGLEAIERLALDSRAVLVSSHYIEAKVKSRAQALGVSILPKSLVPFVPIFISP